MKKRLLLTALFCLFAFSALSVSAESFDFYVIRGPSGIGMIQLFEKAPSAGGNTVRPLAVSDAGLIAGKLISGEAKLGILPPNLAAKIANSGKNVQIAAILGNGMLSLLSADPAVNSIEDLKGKTVESSGQGAVPEYVFRKILEAHGMQAGEGAQDVHLDYSLGYAEKASAMIAGRAKYALLPEPFVTMAMQGNPKLHKIGDVQAEWEKLSGQGNYPMTALVVNGEFAEQNHALLEAVLKAAKSSIIWVNAHPVEAGKLTAKHKLGLTAKVASAAIPHSNYVFETAQEARPAVEALFRAFLDYAPKAIGGKLPGDEFYYK
jgi:NitT/TauT family transport system substrate-binding protein